MAIFWLYLYLLSILYFSMYSCTNIFHRRSLCTFYMDKDLPFCLILSWQYPFRHFCVSYCQKYICDSCCRNRGHCLQTPFEIIADKICFLSSKMCSLTLCYTFNYRKRGKCYGGTEKPMTCMKLLYIFNKDPSVVMFHASLI